MAIKRRDVEGLVSAAVDLLRFFVFSIFGCCDCLNHLGPPDKPEQGLVLILPSCKIKAGIIPSDCCLGAGGSPGSVGVSHLSSFPSGGLDL